MMTRERRWLKLNEGERQIPAPLGLRSYATKIGSLSASE